MKINNAIKEVMSKKSMCAVHPNWLLHNKFLVRYDEELIATIFQDKYSYGDVMMRVIPGLALITKYGNYVFDIELNPSILTSYRKYDITGLDWELIPFEDTSIFNKKIKRNGTT